MCPHKWSTQIRQGKFVILMGSLCPLRKQFILPLPLFLPPSSSPSSPPPPLPLSSSTLCFCPQHIFFTKTFVPILVWQFFYPCTLGSVPSTLLASKEKSTRRMMREMKSVVVVPWEGAVCSRFPRAVVSRTKGELPGEGWKSRTRSPGWTPKVRKSLECRKELEPSNREEQRKKKRNKEV